MSAAKRISPEECEQIRDLRERGYFASQIAQQLGVSKTTVDYHNLGRCSCLSPTEEREQELRVMESVQDIDRGDGAETDGGYQTPLVDDDRGDEEIETPLQITDDGLRLPEQFREETRLIFRTPTMTVDSRLNGQNTRRKKYFYAVSPGDYDEDYLAGEGRTAEIRNGKCLTDDGYRVGILPAGGEQHWLPVEIVGGDSDE